MPDLQALLRKANAKLSAAFEPILAKPLVALWMGVQGGMAMLLSPPPSSFLTRELVCVCLLRPLLSLSLLSSSPSLLAANTCLSKTASLRPNLDEKSVDAAASWPIRLCSSLNKDK